MAQFTRSRCAVNPKPTVAAPKNSAAQPVTPNPPTGSAAWLFRPIGQHGVGCLRITVQTQRGPITERYLFQQVQQGYNLTKQDGTVYLIDTFDPVRPTCNCQDFLRRRASIGQNCKHLRSLAVLLPRLRQPVCAKPSAIANASTQPGRN